MRQVQNSVILCEDNFTDLIHTAHTYFLWLLQKPDPVPDSGPSQSFQAAILPAWVHITLLFSVPVCHTQEVSPSLVHSLGAQLNPRQ